MVCPKCEGAGTVAGRRDVFVLPGGAESVVEWQGDRLPDTWWELLQRGGRVRDTGRAEVLCPECEGTGARAATLMELLRRADALTRANTANNRPPLDD